MGAFVIPVVILLAFNVAVRVTAKLVMPSFPDLYFSEHNWDVNDTHAIAVNSGAYLRLNWTGSADFNIILQPTKPDALTHYMNVAVSLNNAPYLVVPITGNTTSISMATLAVEAKKGPLPSHSIAQILNSTRTFRSNTPTKQTASYTTLELHIYNSLQGANRWHAPAHGGASLIVTGIELADNATTLPPVLKPKRAVFFGDSITEGVNAECHNPDPMCRGGDLCANAATKTWGPAVASAFSAE